ncbi:5-dehydro-4-deoxyglucarate dehydratase [uncultured Pseudokineococcus sp.]|uniref:5-dehydro-4-deoxyglucarate dehydratase n=1 Tax=uncultured Pseudokineococcus sp. TaxID=1642928 RepID=UPI00260EFE9E|nr:5-dehydro-4-deoxyglucarate dehydratase [uncultured Pseudokineococcus sp.]
MPQPALTRRPALSPQDLKAQLPTGLLSFPVTLFDDQLQVDEPRYREHLAWLSGYPVAGLFAAGGTGEGFSMSSSEVDRVVRAAVGEVAGRVPVLAPATGSTVNAVEMARAAQEAGASGLLLMPPYLTEASQQGLADHVSAVCAASDLGVVLYSRANAVVEAETVDRIADHNPTLVGLKDGVGDVERMTRTYARLGDRLVYVGGLPTAETFALPLLELGVSTYSSAIFNFAPAWALDFFDAVRRRDREGVYARLNDFVLPYLDIRDRQRGYAVSIIKAGLTAAGRDGGRVRPPLTDLTETERAELAVLVGRVVD